MTSPATPSFPTDSSIPPSTPHSVYLHQPMAPEDVPNFGLACWFVGIDLAPNDTLETGLAVLDRQRRIVRLDKVNTDQQLVRILESLGSPDSSIIVLDAPKSLSIPSKWRQLEVKFFPLRLEKNDDTGEITDRFSPRAWSLYQKLRSAGLNVYLSFNHLAKTRYGIDVPFRARSPHGCRLLQTLIERELRVTQLPTNMAPSSVLDAMVAAYMAWTTFGGKLDKHFRLYWDRHQRQMLEPVERVKLPPQRVRRYHRYR